MDKSAAELLHELRVHQIELEIQNEELRRTQLDLERLRDEYADLYDFAPVGYLTISKDGLIEKANLTATTLLALDRESLLGTPLSRFVAWDDQGTFFRFRRAVDEKVSHQACEVIFKKADGSTFPAHLDGDPIDSGHPPRSGWRVVFSDISELEGAREQVNLLSRAIDQNADGVCITDFDGVIQYVNARFVEVTGFEPDDVIGRTPRALKSAETSPEVHHDLWRTIRAGRKWRGDIKNRRKDGYEYWTHLTISPIKGQGGVIRHFVGTHEDISERKRMEMQQEETGRQLMRHVEDVEFALGRTDAHAATLASMAEELSTQKEIAEQASRAKSEMLANMSHELRTPLNAIIGFADMMRREVLGPIGSAQYKDYTGDIFTSGQHLLELINDILDLSAVEAGKVELDLEDLDATALIEAVVTLIRGRADKEDVLLAVEASSELPSLRADRRRVKQILLNLLSNAVKFTPKGGKVTLRAFAPSTGDGLVFEVSDTGIGMDDAGIAKAMMPFGQVDGGLDRKHEGTGLGLPLTQSLVELHGGTLAVESAPGKGTTITVALP